jgi:sulfatase modifying factor 1
MTMKSVLPLVLGSVAALANGGLADTKLSLDTVIVGDPGNATDTTGYGSVSYVYAIGKYEVTIGQYTTFLNAVAQNDVFSLYNSLDMFDNLNVAGITRSGEEGSYFYSPLGASNRPITGVNWFSAARFVNWLANGQPVGAQSSATTEDGAYDLSDTDISGLAPVKNSTNPNTGQAPIFWIPTENEWYKAAYYKGNGTSSGYWAYPTQSDEEPGNLPGPLTNQINYNNGVYSLTQSSTYSSLVNYLSDVGTYSNSASFYGTFDQGGNVEEWNDLDGSNNIARGYRGGFWDIGFNSANSSDRIGDSSPAPQGANLGFRIATVPEPSTCALLLLSGAASLWALKRRKS